MLKASEAPIIARHLQTFPSISKTEPRFLHELPLKIAGSRQELNGSIPLKKFPIGSYHPGSALRTQIMSDSMQSLPKYQDSKSYFVGQQRGWKFQSSSSLVLFWIHPSQLKLEVSLTAHLGMTLSCEGRAAADAGHKFFSEGGDRRSRTADNTS